MKLHSRIVRVAALTQVLLGLVLLSGCRTTEPNHEDYIDKRSKQLSYHFPQSNQSMGGSGAR